MSDNTQGKGGEKSVLQRVKEDQHLAQQAREEEVLKSAVRAEDLAKRAEMRKLALADLEDAGREAMEKLPAIKVRDIISERQKAAVAAAKRWAPREVPEDGDVEPIGVWKSARAIKRLNLDSLAPGSELLFDVVPQPGTSINGIVFLPGTRQLLPAHVWAGIYGRTGVRQKNEWNFMFPKNKVNLRTIKYAGGETHRPMRFV